MRMTDVIVAELTEEAARVDFEVRVTITEWRQRPHQDPEEANEVPLPRLL